MRTTTQEAVLKAKHKNKLTVIKTCKPSKTIAPTLKYSYRSKKQIKHMQLTRI
jgi:hypothetical protein